jgi:CCR4-NOT transcriptional regulation complex NOT5 subunit
MRRIASPDKSDFGKNPATGLVAMSSSTSIAEHAEIMMTMGASSEPRRASSRARSTPHSSPSITSTRATSGRTFATSSTAAADVQAVPTTRTPCRSSRSRAVSANDLQSSTMRTPNVTHSELQDWPRRALQLTGTKAGRPSTRVRRQAAIRHPGSCRRRRGCECRSCRRALRPDPSGRPARSPE